jgi:hypothetical protein
MAGCQQRVGGAPAVLIQWNDPTLPQGKDLRRAATNVVPRGKNAKKSGECC